MSGISWSKDGVSIKVPYSYPGVSTFIHFSCADRQLMIDCGDGASSYLYDICGRERNCYEKLSAILITHNHLDHIGGMPALLNLMEVSGRISPMAVVVPGGKNSFLRKLLRPQLGKLHFKLEFIDSIKKRVISIGSVRCRPFRTRHRDSFPWERCGKTVASTGYAISYNSLRLVFSGDTGPCPALRKACMGTDLAVLESTWDTPVDCPGLHLTVEEASSIGSLAKEYILIHPIRERISH